MLVRFEIGLFSKVLFDGNLQIDKPNPNDDGKEEKVRHADNNPDISNDQTDLLPKEVDLQDEIVYYDQVGKS